MQTRSIRLQGTRAQGAQVGAALLRDLLTVLIEGSQRALRIRTQGRSTARGAAPAWIQAATEFSVRVLPGSTVLEIEGPSLLEAAPEEFSQGRLFPEVDPDLPALDYFIESLDAAVEGSGSSALYDAPLLTHFGRLDGVFKQGVDSIEFARPRVDSGARPLCLSRQSLAGLKKLAGQIPHEQQARVAGKLDTIRHSDRTFVLTLEGNAEPIRGIAEQYADLQQFWGRSVLVSGAAHFTASGAILRIEAESIRLASERERGIFNLAPSPLVRGMIAHELHVEQGPRSGLNAILGKWPGTETDDQIAGELEGMS